MKLNIILWLVVTSVFITPSAAQTGKSDAVFYNEPHRPQIHFSPRQAWMNDPNGMVFHDGVYHLFFQYYPDSTVWGPMHWGHATSMDLMRWQHQPVALYPDSLGYIFSGSAVIDKRNTSGLGKGGKVPLVAIFTHHDTVGEKSGRTDFQNQSIAYSLDKGKTWIKYSSNPVLKNPGIVDFRDPKVMWYEPQRKWIMTLAAKDRVAFYSSPDLKAWTKESEFGSDVGAHGGVWECPDLFPLLHDGKAIWVLLVSINPGGPNGGSATQYFTGVFDGKTFTPYQTDTRWIDYGTDNYAGVTWSNTGSRKIFLGWMSNWLYATIVPTVKWRSAATLPRDLALKKVENKYMLTSMPVKELKTIQTKPVSFQNPRVAKGGEPFQNAGITVPCRIDLRLDKAADFSVILSNDRGEKVVIGYDKLKNQFFVDRTQSGNVAFHKDFAGRHDAPRLTNSAKLDMTLVIDASSVELFADEGLSVMTEIFFPTKPFHQIHIESATGVKITTLTYSPLKSIWRK